MNKMTRNVHRGLIIGAIGALTALAWLCAARFGAGFEGVLHDTLKANYAETLALLPSVTLLGLLAFIVGIDPYIRADLKKTMRVIIVAVFSLVAQNFLEYRLAAGEPRWLARTLVAICGYAVRPAILALFLRIVAPDRRHRWAWALVGVNAAVYMTALFSRACFYISPNNSFIRGPLGEMCLYVSVILMIWLFVVTARAFQPQKRMETWVPVLVLLLIAGALVLDANVGKIAQPVSYLTLAIVTSCVAYYIWLHLQFVREHEQDLIAGQRVQLMLSQIKPHFLYNSLGVIEELCASDPQSARTATVMFAQYLRGNMDSLSREGEIPFERELEHTRLYLELEKLRFEDALRVRYDIACMDFFIPPLTLEPLVENAVRHGVRGNPDGRGTVIVATRKYEDRYEITVTDDGPGFDPAAAYPTGESHVGLQNVRDRVLRMRGGVLKIDSAPGAGTTATILLPLSAPVEH